jgi:hypothetical protein
MVTSWPNSERTCRSRLSGFNERNGRHEETRTPDLYRDIGPLTLIQHRRIAGNDLGAPILDFAFLAALFSIVGKIIRLGGEWRI